MFKLLQYSPGYKKELLIILIISIIQVIGIFSIPLFTSNIINIGVINNDINFIISTGFKMLIVSLIIAFSNLISTWISSKFASKIAKNLRYNMFKKIQNLGLNDFEKIGKSSMITRMLNDINLIGYMIILFLQLILLGPLMALIGTIMAFKRDFILSLIIIITMIIFIVFSILVVKNTIPLISKLQVKMDKITKILIESINGIKVIRAFNKQESEKQKFESIITEYSNIAIKINKIMAILVPFAILIINLGVVVILWVGGIKVSNKNTEVGDVVAIIDYCFIILYALLMGIVTVLYIPKSKVSIKRIKEVLYIEPSIKDSCENNKNIDIVNKNFTNNSFIEFKNVYFSYDESNKYFLKDINFSCERGQTIAIIGSLGSGKSTLLRLLPRFLESSEGKILINGIDIKNINQKDLRNNIGFVDQKAFLFSGTIEENIKLGNKNATIDDVINVSKISEAHDFIINLENKYDYKVSQGGTNLSGGQKQRISIARALIKNPSIYIFDDSFSALDFKTEAKLRKNLKKEIKKSNACAIIVAQRITSIIDTDKIIVLDNGKIVGMGTHNELLKNCDLYKNIAQSQNQLNI